MNLVAERILGGSAGRTRRADPEPVHWRSPRLRDALLVNPYDIEQTAEAIRFALEMEPEEKQLRVQRMRRVI